MGFQANSKGFDELRKAVAREPQRVIDEAKNFFVRGLAIYRRTILNNPWRMGGTGGGAPRASGNLAQTHQQEIEPWRASIFPNLQAAPYAPYVHGIDGWNRSRSYQLRPWLDYARDVNKRDIEDLEDTLLDNIVDDLAS